MRVKTGKMRKRKSNCTNGRKK